MTSSRCNVNISLSRNWDHLQNKYVGTGHPDTTKYEWVVNHHRDSLASHVGHYDMMAYFSVAENESIERVRLGLVEKMVQPCGPPPPENTKEEQLQVDKTQELLAAQRLRFLLVQSYG